MVRFSLNVVTGLYLMETDQLPEILSVKIRNNLLTGYQRQLTYVQGAGCFSIWSHRDCSLWLTAFTARYFIEASNPDVATSLGLADDSELIDPEVITSAVSYLIRSQEKSGQFPVLGRLHNYHLLRRDSFVGLTAYVLITLRGALPHASNLASRVQDSIDRAERYLVRKYEDEEFEFCNYGLALTTAAMALSDNSDYSSNVTDMVTELKSRIHDSRTYPGACFLCNDCPSDDDTDSADPASCPSRPRGEGSSSCVETTAYALRALLAVGDSEKTVCLARWLVQVKSASGGFYSSQDTLVALDALRRFAEETFTTNLRKIISVTTNGVSSSHIIHSGNRYQRRDFEVPSVPSTGNCVRYAGVGTAIIQSTLEYYGCSCCDEDQTFSLSLATVKSENELLLAASVSYLGEGSSNMAIVDVEIPSGYEYVGHTSNTAIERVDVRGSNAVFYINGINGTIVIRVQFVEKYVVEDHQQLPVTVYDYYEPDQIVTKYYLPENSGTEPEDEKPTRG
jgi:alpha-2-macroglobulin